MKGRLRRCGFVFVLIAALWIMQRLIEHFAPSALAPEPWRTMTSVLFTIGYGAGALAGLLFPKRVRRLLTIDSPPKLLVWIAALMVFCVLPLFPPGPVRILGVPWPFIWSADYVVGKDRNDDDERVFAGSSDAIRKLVERVRAIHIPMPAPPMPAGGPYVCVSPPPGGTSASQRAATTRTSAAGSAPVRAPR